MTVPSDTHIVCPHCAKLNRIAAGREAEKARCGSCRRTLFRGTPVEVDTAMFERQVSRNSLPVLVDVWAPWCGPCRMMAPAFAEAAARLEPRVRLIKLNADQAPELVRRLGIRGIPTLLLYQHGYELARTAGAMSAADIIGWTEDRLAGATVS